MLEDLGDNKSFRAHTAQSLCFQWDPDLLHKTETEQRILIPKHNKQQKLMFQLQF